jgi:hypothetical protein
MRKLILTTLFVTLFGCALPAVMPEALSTEYKPTGEVMAYGKSASFDAYRVRSPGCNLTKRTDGSWGGTFGDPDHQRGIDVSVDDAHVRGVDFNLNREDSKPGSLIITGQFQGRIFRFEMNATQVLVRTSATSLTYPGRVVGENVVKYGPMQNLELRGEASKEVPPWPQIGFALMAAFQ